MRFQYAEECLYAVGFGIAAKPSFKEHPENHKSDILDSELGYFVPSTLVAASRSSSPKTHMANVQSSADTMIVQNPTRSIPMPTNERESLEKHLIRYRLPDDRSGEFWLVRDLRWQTIKYLADIAEYNSWRTASDFWCSPEPSTRYCADLKKLMSFTSVRSIQKMIADSFLKYALPKSLFIGEGEALTISIEIKQGADPQLEFVTQIFPELTDDEVTAYQMLCKVVEEPIYTTFEAPKASLAKSHQDLARAFAGVVVGNNLALNKALKKATFGCPVEDSLVTVTDALCGHLVRALCVDMLDAAAWVKLQTLDTLRQIDCHPTEPPEYTDSAYFISECDRVLHIAEIERELDL